MTIKKEITLKDFEFWGRARQIVKLFTEDELTAIEYELECIYPEGIDETILNDFFAYNTEFITEMIGMTEEDLLSREE